MLYKKISLPIFPFACLVLAGGCPNNNKAPVSSISDHQDKLHNNKGNGNKLEVSLSSCRPLGSISCMGGAKIDFLLQFIGDISNGDTQSENQVGFIGVPDGAASASVIKNAINAKNDVEKFIWQDEGGFTYWNQVGKGGTGIQEWIIQAGQEAYKKLTSSNYAIQMLYMPAGASAQDDVLSTTPVEMDGTGKGSSLPNYQDIRLKAMDPVENQSGWLLKAEAADPSFLTDAKVGFILIKDEEAGNLLELVKKVIASTNGWPTEATSFSGMTIVPGKLREMDPPIVANLSSSEAPIQGGNFRLLCYLIKNDEHYYLSQMEHIMSNVAESSLSQEGTPPSITFTGSANGLNVLDLKLCRDKISGQFQNVKLSDCKIEYSVSDQVEELPSHLQSSLLFVQKGTIWRTAILESLFQKLGESNSNASTTDDGTICLIADVSKPLDKSCIDFFSRAAEYEYFACLFSKENNKLTFYTQKEALSIEEKEINQTKSPKDPKQDEPKIVLERGEAKITLHGKGLNPFATAYATLDPPKEKLEPSSLENQVTHRGFLITKAEDSVPSKMDEHSGIIKEFINGKGTFVYNDHKKSFIFGFQENLTDRNDLTKQLYGAYKNEKKGFEASLVISYWAEYKNKIICSDPVSLEIK